jgi:hypothetical protein
MRWASGWISTERRYDVDNNSKQALLLSLTLLLVGFFAGLGWGLYMGIR